MKKKLKILEICPFSAGICGVWQRVLSESREFTRLGHEVVVFSSEIEKGTNSIVKSEEKIGAIKIRRFKSKMSNLSENVLYFDFEKEFLIYNPDMVITHLFSPHSIKALNICNEKHIPCLLVTHAPFNIKRRFPLNLVTNFYYKTKIKPNINKFAKIIAISKWEIPYLLELGCYKEKIICISNGIFEDFFKQKKSKLRKQRDVLFLGRIAPVKILEVLIAAAKILPDTFFSIVGSAEKNYLKKLQQLVRTNDNIKIYSPIYDLKKKIKLFDEHKIFVLPSKREGIPQSLIEAMSRGKIVISSKTDGGKELIKDGQNGFLFEIGDYKGLAELIKQNIKENRKVQQKARQTAKQYNWHILIKKYQKIFDEIA